MSDQVAWHVELSVRPGQIEQLEALTAEMVASTRNEPGALCFERFVSDDRQTVHLYERYLDSTAAVEHLQTFQQTFAARFAALVERREFHVFGSPSSQLREQLSGYGAKFFELLDGFSRC